MRSRTGAKNPTKRFKSTHFFCQTTRARPSLTLQLPRPHSLSPPSPMPPTPINSISDLRAALSDTNTVVVNEIDQLAIASIAAIRSGSATITSAAGGSGSISSATVITTGPGMINDVLEHTGIKLTTSFLTDKPSMFTEHMCTHVGPSICAGSMVECAIHDGTNYLEKHIREMCSAHTREETLRLRDLVIRANPTRMAARDPHGIIAFVLACIHDAYHLMVTTPVCTETRKRARFARVTFACMRMCQAIYTSSSSWLSPPPLTPRVYQTGAQGIAAIALASITHVFGSNPNMFIPQVVFSVASLLGPFVDSSRRAILLVHPGYSSPFEAAYHATYISRFIAVQAITSAVHASGGIPFVPDVLVPTLNLIRSAGIQDIGGFTSINDVYEWAVMQPERTASGCPFPICFRQPVLLRDGHVVDVYHGFAGAAVDAMTNDRFIPPIHSINNPLRNGGTYAHYLRAWAHSIGAMGVIAMLQDRKDGCNFVQDFRLAASNLYYGSATMDSNAPRHIERVCNMGNGSLNAKSILYTNAMQSGVPFGPSPQQDPSIIVLRRPGVGSIGANIAYQVAREANVELDFSFSDCRKHVLPVLPDGMSPRIHGRPFDRVSDSELDLADWGSVLSNRMGGAMASPSPPSPLMLPTTYDGYPPVPDWSLRTSEAAAAAAQKKRSRPPTKAAGGVAKAPRVRKPPAVGVPQPPKKRSRPNAASKKAEEKKEEDSA